MCNHKKFEAQSNKLRDLAIYMMEHEITPEDIDMSAALMLISIEIVRRTLPDRDIFKGKRHLSPEMVERIKEVLTDEVARGVAAHNREHPNTPDTDNPIPGMPDGDEPLIVAAPHPGNS